MVNGGLPETLGAWGVLCCSGLPLDVCVLTVRGAQDVCVVHPDGLCVVVHFDSRSHNCGGCGCLYEQPVRVRDCCACCVFQIFASTHVYSPMHFLMAGLQILGCVFMACGHFKSLSFGVDAGKLPREKSGMSAIDEDAPMTTATARLLSSSKLPKRANDDRDSRCAQARSRSVGDVEDGGTSTMDGFPFQAF